MQIDGTLYVGKNVTNMFLNTSVNSKKVIMNSLIKDYATIQRFPNIESCWLSKDIIKDINTVSMFLSIDAIKNKNMIIYSDATENDSNWPKNWNPYGLTVKYGVSLEDYQKIE